MNIQKIDTLKLSMTPGVNELLEVPYTAYPFTPKDVEGLLHIALYHKQDSRLVVFKPNTNGLQTWVTDGQENVLGDLPFPIPKEIWMVHQEESERSIFVVAMRPWEY